MILYGSYRAESPCRIDYLMFEFPEVPEAFIPEDFEKNEDMILSVFWDESDWAYEEESKEGFFRCKGVSINDVYANGHAGLFEGAIFDAMQVYADPSANFRLTELEFCDGEDTIKLPEGKLLPRELVYEPD